MVRLVNLDDEDDVAHLSRFGVAEKIDTSIDDGVERLNLNFDTGFARAMGCYPIISTLATFVDLTTLHNIALTCRQVRANLLIHRNTLVTQTLRCDNENADPALRLGSALQASFQQWSSYAQTGDKIGRVSGGKVGACARDMVGECRRCGTLVCRNCTMKPPTPKTLIGRLRRLCRSCMKSPLAPHMLTNPLPPPPSSPPSSSHSEDEPDHPSTPVAISFTRTPCTCPAIPWLCRPCAQPARIADTTYMRGWAWRTHYSNCGGMGAGLGEGNEGVECGRSGSCLAATVVEKELEYDETLDAVPVKQAEEGGCREWAGSSYTTVEVVGIGGVVRRKVKELVRVGAVVKEYEDERTTLRFLRREQEGANRAWCSWCERVVLGRKDEGGFAELKVGSRESVVSERSSSP